MAGHAASFGRPYGYGGRGFRYVAPIRFIRPYYAFRPRFSIGFGLWVGFPIAYSYPYYYPAYYPYPYPYDYYSYGYPYASAYGTPYPPSYGSAYPPSYSGAYPTTNDTAYSSSYPTGTVGVQPRTMNQSASGGVSFDITPSDAEVLVDGVAVGTVGEFTPTSQPLGLTAGRHRIEIRSPGYQTISVEAEIVAGQVIPYQGTMQR